MKILDIGRWKLALVQNNMADRVKGIDECISTANNLRATVNKVFQDLATDPSGNKETGDSSESSKGASITQTLKKNLTNVHKALR